MRSSQEESEICFSNLPDPDGFFGGINSKNALPGQIVSIDPVGPISPKTISGFSLMWLVYDNGFSFLIVRKRRSFWGFLLISSFQ